jgi:hypothetical protein
LLCAVDAYQRRGIASAVRREIAYPAVSSSCRITTPFLKRHPRPEAKNTALGRQGPKKNTPKARRDAYNGPDFTRDFRPDACAISMDEGFACHPELRCVKTRRINSRSNIYTNVSQPLRALPGLGYEPAVRGARLSVSVGKVIDRISYVSVAHDGIRSTFSRSAY